MKEKLSEISTEALVLTASVLNSPELHYRACFEDLSGRPDFDCDCDILTIQKKIKKELSRRTKV